MTKIEVSDAARYVIMSAYLHYRCHRSILSDAEYDRLSVVVADNWDQLSLLHQHQLGTPGEILSSGYHVLMTRMSEYDARSWFRAERQSPLQCPLIPVWVYNARFNCHFGRITS